MGMPRVQATMAMGLCPQPALADRPDRGVPDLLLAGESGRNARRYGGRRQCVRRMDDIGIDTPPSQAKASKTTDSTIDAALSKHPDPARSADRYCDRRRCIRHAPMPLPTRGATSFIASRRNAPPRAQITACAIAGNDRLRASGYPDRALWRSCSGYRCGSHVATTMHGVTLPGQRLIVRNAGRNAAKVQGRCTVLGVAVTKAQMRIRLGKGTDLSSADRHNTGGQPRNAAGCKLYQGDLPTHHKWF